MGVTIRLLHVGCTLNLPRRLVVIVCISFTLPKNANFMIRMGSLGLPVDPQVDLIVDHLVDHLVDLLAQPETSD